MKRLIGIILIISFLFGLTACFRFRLPLSPEQSMSEDLTSPYGDVIPTYENVGYTALDPSLFKRDDNGRMYYDDPDVKSFLGIDVSVFQGDIDWTAVKNDGVDFVMLRIGYRGYGPEGKLGVDDKFEENYRNASSAGLKVGAYFFSQATTAAEAREEASFVLDRIRGLSLDYPIAYDWEHIDYDNARTDNMTNEQISECAAAFCDRISAAGYPALIYFNRELGYFNYDLSMVSDCHFWVAEYVSVPSFVFDYKIWQYEKTGRVNGIEGNVDMNICVYDYAGNDVVEK